jgi:4-amino-4-deoxy-L-arabinose transferase-like glycosyltransferase
VSSTDASHPSHADLPPQPWTKAVREALLIGLMALTINLAGNGRISLWDRDEPRYAGCVREMRASGDYIDPHFNAEPRYHKPILIYWLMLGATALAGDNPFGARLVSAIAGTGTCLLVWGLGRRMFGRTTGRLAALALATAPIFVIESKLATTDATLTFFLVACQFALWELGQRPSRAMTGVFWVSLALATLTKGPVGPVVIAVSTAVSWWWGGPRAWVGRLRWSWGLPVYALITAPWYIAIGIISRGDFFRVSMGYHVLRRMTTGIETHGGWPGYYALLTVGVFAPWAALLPAALLGAWSRRRESPGYGFVLGWLVGPWIFFELVRTKIIHYFLPAYPAAALLAAWLIVAVSRSEANLRRWPLGRLSLGLLTGTGIAMTVGLLAGALVLPAELRWPCVVVALILAPGTLYAMERFQAGKGLHAASGLVATWAVALLVLSTWLVPATDRYRLSPRLAEKLAELARSQRATPILTDYKAPSVIYYYGQPVKVWEGRGMLIDLARREGAVVAGITQEEVGLLRRTPELRCDLLGTVEGVDVEHARYRRLHLGLIRPAEGSEAIARLPQQTGVQ